MSNYSSELKHAAENLKSYKKIVFTAVSNRGIDLRYSFQELRNDREVAVAWVSQGWDVYRSLSQELKKPKRYAKRM